MRGTVVWNVSCRWTWAVFLSAGLLLAGSFEKTECGRGTFLVVHIVRGCQIPTSKSALERAVVFVPTTCVVIAIAATIHVVSCFCDTVSMR